MQQSMLTATGLPCPRRVALAPVFGVRGSARKAFGGRKFVVKAVQERHQNERKHDVHGKALGTPP